MIKKIATVLAVVVLCLSLVFYDNIVALFNTSVNKTLGRDVTSGYGVSSSNELAVEVGMKVLKDGGNAVDAAAAISYVLGVVEPYGSGIGGGGAMLVYLPDSKDYKFYNYRETAPITSETMKSTIGVPGFVKGIEQVQKEHGKLKMSDLLEPAIEYARDGFEMNQNLYNRLSVYKGYTDLSQMTQFFDDDGEPRPVGENIVQPELAETLTEIQKNGSDAFYSGSIADKLVASASGLKKEDLASYKIEEQKPVTGTFNGYDIVTAPAPFSGITLLQILNMIEYVDLPSYDEDPAKYLEEMSKITNIAYTSRQANISDPNFNTESKNYNKLTTAKYAKYLYNKNEVSDIEDMESEDTTAFVVTDSSGMIVSCTNTLGDFFGSQLSVGGFFLNDASTHFNQNEYSINSYEAGKRSRTFIAPSIISKGDEFVMGISTQGGNVIPQALAQVINWNLREGVDLQKSVDKPRFVFRGKEIYSEEDISNDIKQKVAGENKKYSIIYYDSNVMYGSIQAITKHKNLGIKGAADARRRGTYQVKY